MEKKKKYYLLLLLFYISLANAQEVTVIDQKGTKNNVTRNMVTTSPTAPSNAVEGDVWRDNSGAPIVSKIYDGTTWFEINTATTIIVAAGKINADGTAAKTLFNATSTRASRGQYLITFSTPRPDANYVIQLTLRDTNGAGNDDYDISYHSQTVNSFMVKVGDNDNGVSNRRPRDFEFMFTVIDY
ncbi:hypothetical protein VOI54_13280 [Tamlana sp. 2201CG12-4]|uniref:hypothetical protein n=1 Tax=Tamlana sp. 2201CG12-4 TaxID=3112582 RepID=UPI002DC05E0B|nr:hypothetical protein [Tamlana sp. 2201CG12-4]MEC3907997.1 hypothetical protein [Tamlana sp. 2201CG12-4]